MPAWFIAKTQKGIFAYLTDTKIQQIRKDQKSAFHNQF